MSIGENIKKHRNNLNLTQKQLAEKAKVSESAIKYYENNRRKAKIETLNKIAEALEISTSELLKIDKTLTQSLIDTLEYPLLKMYGPSEPLDILSNKLDIDSALLNSTLDNNEDLPIDIQIKLLEFLSTIDTTLFMNFIEENEEKLKIPALKKVIQEILSIKIIESQNNSIELFKKYLLLTFGDKINEFINDENLEDLHEEVNKFLEFALYKIEKEYYGEDTDDD